METSFFTVNNRADLERVYPVMKELRPHVDLEQFVDIYENAKRTGDYKIVGYENRHQVVAVMGYRILYDYVHGKHLYVDDLVTTKDMRSQGLGAKLLKFAEEEARSQSCKGLRLCTGIENQDGKKFYEREGWQLRAVAYKKKI